jgi:hypothetical protein
MDNSTSKVFTRFAVICLLSGCQANETSDPQRIAEPDPARCEAADLGEAADLFAKGDPPSGCLARIDGLTDPRTLVWKDEATGAVFFITRVMGTQRRLYYMAPVKPGEEPKALSVVEGHLQRWSDLEPRKGVTLSRALEREYSLKIDPQKTYLLTAGEQPAGCP